MPDNQTDNPVSTERLMELFEVIELTIIKAPWLINGATKDIALQESRNEMKVLQAFSSRSNV